MDLLTEKQLADKLGKAVATVRRWRYGDTGNEGPAFVRAGGSILYRKEDVDAWLDASRVATAAPSQSRGSNRTTIKRGRGRR